VAWLLVKFRSVFSYAVQKIEEDDEDNISDDSSAEDNNNEELHGEDFGHCFKWTKVFG
jgi:hypothetical protein